MEEIILQFLLNHILAFVIMAAAVFRAYILAVWNKCVNFFCFASKTVINLIFAVAVSGATVLSAMGASGSIAISEYAVSRFLPVVCLMILAFAIIYRLVYGFVFYIRKDINKFFHSAVKVVARERDSIDTFARPRFVLLQ